MIDLAHYRSCSGIERVVLVKRIRELCNELAQERSEHIDDAHMCLRLMRDNKDLLTTIGLVQQRCTELVEELRALKREVGT